MISNQKKWNIAVMASGNGSNLQALIDGCENNEIHGGIDVVVSNKPGAYALTRAKNAGIETMLFEPEKFESRSVMCAKTAKAFKERGVDLICLAGYLLRLEPCLIRSFPNRILNIHPALLPKYGGKGMYGRNVHAAVIAAGEKKSGCSVHLVDEVFDHGPVIAQVQVPVEPNDTPETLAARILPEEHQLYRSVVAKVCSGQINLDSFQKNRVISDKNTSDKIL